MPQTFDGEHPCELCRQVKAGVKKERQKPGKEAEAGKIKFAVVLPAAPLVLAGVGSRLVAEAGADLPVLIDNTSFQVVPSYRVRAGFSVKF